MRRAAAVLGLVASFSPCPAHVALAAVAAPPPRALGAVDLPTAIALLAASLAVAASTIAAAIALKAVASAGFAASAERPQLTTWLLIMGGLAEGIAIYGLLIALLILFRVM